MIHVGVGDAGHQVGGARTQCRQTDAGVTRESSVHIRHKGGALFVTRGDEANTGVQQRVHQVEVLLARHAEDVLDTLVFEAFNQ
jgi:hypothetical protein